MNLEDAHALIVGISAYRHVRPLPQVQDAEDVAALLADPARCGYPAAQIRVLLESAATRAAILGALDELAARARPSSTVFIYFSGHGGAAIAPPGGPDRCYLMPVDAGWGEPAELEATAIAGAELSRRLGALAARRVTVVLDCCRAAGIAEPRSAGEPWRAEARDVVAPLLGELTPDAVAPLAVGRGRAVLAASRADGPAFVMLGERNGVFTRHLLDGLRGGASRAGGVVRICDLFDYVQAHVVAEQPGQRPVFKAELEENYPIARAPEAPPPVDVPPAPDAHAYDVFVSYARRDPDDRAWVERVLVPFLERAGLRACLEHRDFRLGQPRIREMERAVTESRYTLAVLSPSYVRDGFTDFQALLAQHRSLETRAPRLVPVLRRECRLELGTRMTSLLDLSADDDVPAGLARLALALREPPHPRLDP
ncbi:MAG TPA: TIR domain-containing protein [Kofleriaceae bacterium]|nr:TIR domain-containing protein [Kofleriaceae bacterium]